MVPGSDTNLFFPALGNHDWTDGGGLQAYLDFFTLPESSSGNERYYDFVMGPVQFFMVDADPREPDGETARFGPGGMAAKRASQTRSRPGRW